MICVSFDFGGSEKAEPGEKGHYFKIIVTTTDGVAYLENTSEHNVVNNGMSINARQLRCLITGGICLRMCILEVLRRQNQKKIGKGFTKF